MSFKCLFPSPNGTSVTRLITTLSFLNDFVLVTINDEEKIIGDKLYLRIWHYVLRSKYTQVIKFRYMSDDNIFKAK